MGSFERSKKRIHLWKKALFHFSLCFVMGFFTGFAPTNAPYIFSNSNTVLAAPIFNQSASAPEHDTAVGESSELVEEIDHSNMSLMVEPPTVRYDVEDNEEELNPRRLLIVITPTRSSDQFHGVFLRRLGNTLKLAPPPLLWIVVETHSVSSETNEILRKSGIMYRHLVTKENFTNEKARTNHQMNVALNHIEHHRLDGIVHFAGVYNIYDLQFFEDIRDIGVFGTWPIALVSPNRNKVVVEGPVCSSSQVMGWHLKNANDEPISRPYIPISIFAFNSSVLWDPERWGRASSIQDTSQDSIEFVKQVVLEDETKLKGIPQGCSKVMLWHLRVGVPRLHQITILGSKQARGI